MRRTVISLTFALLFGIVYAELSPPAWGVAQEISILAADDRGVTLGLNVPALSLERFQGPSGSYERLSVKGWAKTSVPGCPELPVVGIFIPVPPTGEINLEILEHTYRSTTPMNIYPVPRISVDELGKSIESFYLDDLVYASSEPYPKNPVEISPRQFARGSTFVRVLFHPFQWNPSTKELHSSEKVNVRINFQSPSAASVDSSLSSDQVSGVSSSTVVDHYSVNGNEEEAPYQHSVVLGSSTALRIEVQSNGLYQLSYSQLADAGVPLKGINPSTFQLFNLGKEVAIRVVAKNSTRFQSGDFLEFYAQGWRDTFSDTNVYWLYWGSQPGRRVGNVTGAPTGKGTKLVSVYSTIHFEENHRVWAAMPGAQEEDYWFWDRLVAPAGKSLSLSIPAPATTDKDGVIKVNFRGFSLSSSHPNHHTRLSLNGVILGDAFWDDDNEYNQEMSIPAGLLSDGVNNVDIDLPGDTGATTDISYLNWIELGYWQRLEAIGDQLTFTVTGNDRILMEIGKFSQNGFCVYNISNPYDIKRITGFQVKRDGAEYKVAFEDLLKGSKTYWVTTRAQIKNVNRLELWQPSNLKHKAQGADYLLITAREFLPWVTPLCNLRSEQGFRVKAIAVEDIYNDFNYGLLAPQAIKSFLRYAYNNWQRPRPSFVLLLGDANMDYHDYLGTGKKNYVPTNLTLTPTVGLTPDDTWFVSVSGDDPLPDMMIGRLPANSPEAAGKVAAKIVGYEKASGYIPRSALFIADNDEIGFDNLNNALADYLPSDYASKKVFLRDYSNVDDATQAVISYVNEGPLLTNYVGHGDVLRWGQERLFEKADILSLTNAGKLTFLLTFTCLNGYFAHFNYYSIAEELVVAEEKGAVASFAPSGADYLWEHEILAKEVFSRIFRPGSNSLGVVTTRAKIAAFGKGITQSALKTFTLLGDPATRLKTSN